MCIQIDIITLHRCPTCRTELHRTRRSECRCRVCQNQVQRHSDSSRPDLPRQSSSETSTAFRSALINGDVPRSWGQGGCEQGDALVPMRPGCTAELQRHEVVSSFEQVAERPCGRCEAAR
jgi:hypothetical protein